MNDAEKIQALKTLAQPVKQREKTARRKRVASVRVSPGGYLAAASVLTFASVLLLRSERDPLALVALAAAWLLMPALAFSDRIVFDGQSLIRRGVVPFIFRVVGGRKQQLGIADFERVDTNAVRTVRRGGNVRYRYRTNIAGKGISFVIASGGRGYRRMVRELFPLIHDQKLDARTRELRDYLCEPGVLTRSAAKLNLASSMVLDNAASEVRNRIFNRRAAGEGQSADDRERARLLRQLANELRVAGRLRGSREAFRRALIVLPREAGLIYEFARLLRSEASAMGDAKLLSRARAALRLASLRAGEDSSLLSLIGESQVECGEIGRAERCFLRALNFDSQNFRARTELADLALRNGKLAHVIHHYRDATHLAPDKALAAYARREADYYARLNDDDDYLATELRRIAWLQNASKVRRLAARITNASILVALVGSYVAPSVAGIGWSLASSSLFAWVSALFVGKILADRRKPRPAQ
jgi:tetratricopeptide (TPR) repeat protein